MSIDSYRFLDFASRQVIEAWAARQERGASLSRRLQNRCEKQKNFAALSVYFHPVVTSTAYRGSVEVTFYDTASGVYGTPVDVTVQPRQSPVANTLSGLLRQKPGEYVIAIAVVAYPSGQVAREIREAIPVAVK